MATWTRNGVPQTSTTTYGNLGIGTASPDGRLHVYTQTNNTPLLIIEHESDLDTSGDPQGGNILMRCKDSNSVLRDNAVIGDLAWQAWDGDEYFTSAMIRSETEGATSNGSAPADLTFWTNAGASTATKRMTIDKDGDVSLSQNLTIAGDLTVTGNNISGSGAAAITFNGDDINASDNINLVSNASYLTFGADSEVMLLHLEDKGLLLRGNTAITNTDSSPLTLSNRTSGTPSAGIGTAITFEAETSNSNDEEGMKLVALTTDVSVGAEDFDFTVELMENGNAAAERMRLTHAGNLSVTGTVTSGVTYTQYFGISEVSPDSAGYHITLNNGMMNASPTGADSTALGNGTDPATTLDFSAITDGLEEDLFTAFWYVPINCTITEVKALATTDGTNSETLRFHVMQYDLDTSSNPGDLASGVVKASSADIASLTRDSMKVSSAFTLNSADLTAGKIVMVTMEADDASDKISAQVYINYKAR